MLPADPGESYVRQTLERARGRVTILTTADAVKYPGQVFLARVLQEAGVRLVVVAVGGPYDLTAFPHVGTYIATYGANPPAIDALIEVLTGRAPAVGRLPVRCSGAAPVTGRGHRMSHVAVVRSGELPVF